ncbi:MAG TPA: trehalose-6-phosphate synthase [Terriglobales bacterium]|nr:trehalose-6-phosphate synthase [Terriglobales bacterium]
MRRGRRLVVVSNRLPVTVNTSGNEPVIEHSSGGLVTALSPVLQQYSGYWIGWTGTERSEDIDRLFDEYSCGGYELVPLYLTNDERINFYLGFSNEILWPLFHDLQTRCNFDPAYWQTYVNVNDKFAKTLVKVASPADLVWVQDYHLMLVAEAVKQRSPDWELAYFHHIPFPSPDMLEKLPWRTKILEALLHFNLLGFQTKRDRRNFVSCVREFLPEAEVSRIGERTSVSLGTRRSLLGDFPIGIDFEQFSSGASDPAVAERAAQIKSDLGGCAFVLGLDRLDYTKGIPERLRAFRSLLEADPEIHGKIALVQVVVPSRVEIPKYRDLRADIERLVSSINGSFGKSGWVPVHYLHRNMEKNELLAYYRGADIALITPLKDGMNLVCKEYCASQVDEQGVLVLSEFAGAATQLKDAALLVNPNDFEAVGQTIRAALNMSPEEKRQRMRRLRKIVARESVYRWAKHFLYESRRTRRPLCDELRAAPFTHAA